jgi:hypothetical protein
MKKLFAVAAIPLSFALALPAAGANVSITLGAGGTLGSLNLAAGQTATVLIPQAVGCIDFGIYERPGTIITSTVDIVGGGYKKTGASLRLAHLYGAMKAVTVTARQDTGIFHVVWKPMSQATCLKMARSQAKA